MSTFSIVEESTNNCQGNKRIYSDKDYLSLVSMVCIQLATTVVKNENDSAYKEQYLDKQLDTINALLTENIDLSV